MARYLGDDADILYLKFHLYNKFYNLRREAGVEIQDFFLEFENQYFELLEEHIQMPDPVKAFMLLSASVLSEENTHLVMLEVSSDINYDNMKTAILRVTSNEMDVEDDPLSDEEIRMRIETIDTKSVCEDNDERIGDKDNDRGCKRLRYNGPKEMEFKLSQQSQSFVTCFYCDNIYRWRWKCNCVGDGGNDRDSAKLIIFNRKMKFRRLRQLSKSTSVNFRC